MQGWRLPLQCTSSFLSWEGGAGEVVAAGMCGTRAVPAVSQPRGLHVGAPRLHVCCKRRMPALPCSATRLHPQRCRTVRSRPLCARAARANPPVHAALLPRYGTIHSYNYVSDCEDFRSYPLGKFVSEFGERWGPVRPACVCLGRAAACVRRHVGVRGTRARAHVRAHTHLHLNAPQQPAPPPRTNAPRQLPGWQSYPLPETYAAAMDPEKVCGCVGVLLSGARGVCRVVWARVGCALQRVCWVCVCVCWSV
jgi:hypothetical protein